MFRILHDDLRGYHTATLRVIYLGLTVSGLLTSRLYNNWGSSRTLCIVRKSIRTIVVGGIIRVMWGAYAQ